MKRMGLGIVYSDYDRILINTHKYSYENAKQAVRYYHDSHDYPIVSFLIQSNQKMCSD